MEGQYVAYTFYRVDPAWRRLPIDERQAGKEAFVDAVEELSERFELSNVRADEDGRFESITVMSP